MPTLHEQIQTLVNDGKTQEALSLFSETGTPDAKMLQFRYDSLLKAFSEGKASEGELHITHNRIHYALLEMTKTETAAPEPTGDIRAQTQHLVAKGETELALKLLISAGNPKAAELLARFKKAQEQYAGEGIDFGRWSAILADINRELLGSSPSKALADRPLERPMPQFSPAEKLTTEEAAPQIRQALREGNLSEAINLLLRTGAKESDLWYKHFSNVEQQSNLGLLDSEGLLQQYARLSNEILAMDWMKETVLSQMTPSEEEKAQILQLLDERKTEQALRLCDGFGDDCLLVQANFATAKKLFEKGQMDTTLFEKRKNHCGYALQETLHRLSEEKDIAAESPITLSAEESPGGGWLGKLRRMFG